MRNSSQTSSISNVNEPKLFSYCLVHHFSNACRCILIPLSYYSHFNSPCTKKLNTLSQRDTILLVRGTQASSHTSHTPFTFINACKTLMNLDEQLKSIQDGQFTKEVER
jgi:hypothetical protein